jgi:hypothetical protein
MKFVLLSLISFLPWWPALLYVDNLQWGMTWSNENTFIGGLLLVFPVGCLIACIKKKLKIYSVAISLVLIVNAYAFVHGALVTKLGASSKADVDQLELGRYFTEGIWGGL